MADLPNRDLDLRLIRKEIEVQGELLAQEKLERTAEVDRLKLEILSLKNALEQMSPGFLRSFDKAYDEERESFDPESEKPVRRGA